MTDTGLDELTDENADDTPYPTWEEADQNEEQLQSAQCVWERSESYLSDANNDPYLLKCMTWLNAIMTYMKELHGMRTTLPNTQTIESACHDGLWRWTGSPSKD